MPQRVRADWVQSLPLHRRNGSWLTRTSVTRGGETAAEPHPALFCDWHACCAGSQRRRGGRARAGCRQPPKTAWTHASGDASPDRVDHVTAQIVGSHCDTVPGWAYRNCQRWIVLRNPWGDTDATTSILDATISMYDVSWWRPITLKDNDGVFAVEIGAFKKYFAGFGTAH